MDTSGQALVVRGHDDPRAGTASGPVQKSAGPVDAGDVAGGDVPSGRVTGRSHARGAGGAGKAERSRDDHGLLDGRQLFVVFVGTAIAACLIFAGGVFVGRRVEQRAIARAAAQATTDPLAVIDQLANAEEELTFPRALRERAVRESAARSGGGHGDATERPRGEGNNGTSRSPMPHYTLQSAPVGKRTEAEELVKRLRQAGYKATLVELPRSALAGGGRELRVQLGDFVAAEQGQALRGELFRRFNLSTTVTKL